MGDAKEGGTSKTIILPEFLKFGCSTPATASTLTARDLFPSFVGMLWLTLTRRSWPVVLQDKTFIRKNVYFQEIIKLTPNTFCRRFPKLLQLDLLSANSSPLVNERSNRCYLVNGKRSADLFQDSQLNASNP